MFGKINFASEIAAVNSEMLAWTHAEQIGRVLTLPRAPLLIARVKRSQDREMREFCEFEVMRRRGWLDIVTQAVDEGQIPRQLADVAATLIKQARPELEVPELAKAVNEGCFWGLALALPEKERVGENPPVARTWALEAFNRLEVPFHEESHRSEFLSAARWTFIEARAGRLVQ